jgi:hypothetical protein
MPTQRKCTYEDLLSIRNIFHGSVVDATGLRHDHLLRTTWWMSDVALRDLLLWHGALSSEVARATTVEAGVAGCSPSGRGCRQVHHRQRWRKSLRCCPLVLTLRWAGSSLLWLTLVLVLLRLSRWIGGAVVVHRPILWGSTTGWSCHNLPIISFLVGAYCIIRDHDIAHKLWKCPSSVECHALL